MVWVPTGQTSLIDCLNVVKNHVVFRGSEFRALCQTSRAAYKELEDCPIAVKVPQLWDIALEGKTKPAIVDLEVDDVISYWENDDTRVILDQIRCRLRRLVVQIEDYFVFGALPVIEQLQVSVYNLGGENLIDLGTLPSSLEFLSLHTGNEIRCSLESPDKLKKLHLYHAGCNGFWQSFQTLPKNLDELEVHFLCENPKLSNMELPKTLRRLHVNRTPYSLPGLPPKLEELLIEGNVTFTCESLNLPETLHTFLWSSGNVEAFDRQRKRAVMLHHMSLNIPLIIPESFRVMDLYNVRLASISIPNTIRGIEMDGVSFSFAPGQKLCLPRGANYVHAEDITDCGGIEFAGEGDGPRVLDLRDVPDIRELTLPSGVRDVRLTEMNELVSLSLPETVESLRLEKVNGLPSVLIPPIAQTVVLVNMFALKSVSLPPALKRLSVCDNLSLESMTFAACQPESLRLDAIYELNELIIEPGGTLSQILPPLPDLVSFFDRLAPFVWPAPESIENPSQSEVTDGAIPNIASGSNSFKKHKSS